MFIYLPTPYEDELLYSVVARYFCYSRTRHTRKVITAIFGNMWECSVDLPRGLSIVAERTRPILHMSGRDIANHLTMYPYYVAFLPPPIKEKVLEAILNRSRSSSFGYLTALMPQTLRYCPKCRATDLLNYQETYWRRSHQMKGIVVCPVHGEELIDTGIQKNRKSHYTDATNATSAGGKQVLQLNQEERKQAWALAQRCQMILQGRLEQPWSGATPSFYKELAREKGFYNDQSHGFHKVIEVFKQMHSDTLIATTGLAQASSSASWLTRILNPLRPYALQPVAHAVIQEFLSKVPQQTATTDSYGTGPWNCPNPFSNHKDPLPVKKIKIVRCKHTGTPIAYGKCCCGFYFSFLDTEKADTSMPIVHKVQQYGPTWRREITRLRDAGLAVSEVCNALKICVAVYYSILNGTKFEKYLQTLRLQWHNVILQTKHKKVSEAQILNPQLYRRLRRLDPCFGYISIVRVRGCYKKSAYWKHRDRIVSLLIKKTGREIVALEPPVRASATAILNKCSFETIFYHHRLMLPKCEVALRNICESMEDFQKRRLKYILEVATKEGLTLTRSQIFQMAGIGRKGVKQKLESYLDSLLRRKLP